MSDSLIQMEVSPRTVFGKAVGARRRQGLIPANIVIKGEDSLAIETSQGRLLKVLREVGYTQALELLVGERKVAVLVSEVTYAPTSDIPQHVVFTAVKRGETVHAAVPLVLSGQAPGEQKGLLVLQMLDTLDVVAPAFKIPEQLPVEIGGLEENGDVVRIDDLSLPSDVSLSVDVDGQTPVVRLEVSRSQVASDAEESVETTAEEADGQPSEETDKATDSGGDEQKSKEQT